MTKQECLQHIKGRCEQLQLEDNNLTFSVRNPDYDQLDVAYVVVICHKALAEEVRTGKRVSYNYMVVRISNEAIAYKNKEWFDEQLASAARNVQSQCGA